MPAFHILNPYPRGYNRIPKFHWWRERGTDNPDFHKRKGFLCLEPPKVEKFFMTNPEDINRLRDLETQGKNQSKERKMMTPAIANSFPWSLINNPPSVVSQLTTVFAVFIYIWNAEKQQQMYPGNTLTVQEYARLPLASETHLRSIRWKVTTNLLSFQVTGFVLKHVHRQLLCSSPNITLYSFSAQ